MVLWLLKRENMLANHVNYATHTPNIIRKCNSTTVFKWKELQWRAVGATHLLIVCSLEIRTIPYSQIWQQQFHIAHNWYFGSSLHVHYVKYYAITLGKIAFEIDFRRIYITRCFAWWRPLRASSTALKRQAGYIASNIGQGGWWVGGSFTNIFIRIIFQNFP